MTQSPGTLTSRGPPRVTETCGLHPVPVERPNEEELWGLVEKEGYPVSVRISELRRDLSFSGVTSASPLEEAERNAEQLP